MIKPDSIPVGNSKVIKIEDLELNDTFSLITDSQDRDLIREDIPFYTVEGEEFSYNNNFDSFFVQVLDGDYGLVFGFYGTVPYLDKEITRVL